MLATAILAGGERVSELTALRRRDVDLAAATLRIGVSKNDAGKRTVDLSPLLRDELAAYIASTDFSSLDAYLFPTQSGGRRERNNVRERIFYPAVRRANEVLAAADRPLISSDVTFHSLRRTMASLLAEANADPKYASDHIGHTRSAFTLDVYTDVHKRRDDPLARVDALILAEQARDASGPDAREDSTDAMPDAAPA